MNGALRSWMRRRPAEVVSFHLYSSLWLWSALLRAQAAGVAASSLARKGA